MSVMVGERAILFTGDCQNANNRLKDFMTDSGPLTSAPLIAFVATRDPPRAREFYQRVLGLELVSEDQFALVFNAGGTMLHIATVQELNPPKYTVLGWNVASIEKTIDDLNERGVQFERI